MHPDLERALLDARRQLEAARFTDPDALAAVYDAERRLAAAKGEQWAEVIDIGGRWDAGAPLPHLVSNGSTALVVCHAATHDPNWNGTFVRVVSPSDTSPSRLLRLTFDGLHSIKFGGPNDEVMHGHPLHGRGLEGYEAHLVHNSSWIADERAINSVHPFHSDRPYRELNHYLLAFHDETLEALAGSLTAETIEGSLGEVLMDAARRLVSP